MQLITGIINIVYIHCLSFICSVNRTTPKTQRVKHETGTNERDTRKAMIPPVTLHIKNISVQWNLTAQIGPVQDKHFYISIVNCYATIELFSCFVCDILPHILSNLKFTLTCIESFSHQNMYFT